MFVSQAHSFTQQARLAITLAWVAGHTNAVAILSCDTVVSHVSGTTSNLGRDVAERKWGLALFALYLLVTFVFGAAISGLSTEYGRRNRWESIYVLPMAIEALLLAAFALGIEFLTIASATDPTRWLLTGTASAAMGLQNATITRISSGVVRTTHVTGVLTDLGTELVQFFWWCYDRRANVPPGSVLAVTRSLHTHPTARRLAMLASIIGSFAVGAGLGAAMHEWFPAQSMLPPVAFLVWIIYQDTVRPIAEIEESDLLDPADLGLPSELAIFHLKPHDRRGRKAHRIPNLDSWLARLDDHVRVVVLDLGHLSRLDSDSAFRLVELIVGMRRQGRRLVVAGITGEQYELLRRAGAGDQFDPMSACPDLELAVARALNLLEQIHREHPRPASGLGVP